MGHGGVYRDSTRVILYIYYGSIGLETNNTEDIEGLMLGINIVSRSGWFPVTVEGDSRVIIQMARNISNGKRPEKVATSWRIMNKLENMGALLSTNLASHFRHVRRESNKVASLLDNVGVGGGHHIKEI